PIRSWLLMFRRASLTAVSRHCAPSFNHGFTVSAFAVGRQRRRHDRMATLLELPHQGLRDFLFGLSDGAPDPEARVGLKRRAAPEGAPLRPFWPPFFSPLWPT